MARLTLTHITLQGTMEGIFWQYAFDPGAYPCEVSFTKDFAAPGAPHSPWQSDWVSLDEALQEALATGDLVGGMGDLVEGSIVFHMVGEGRSVRITKDLSTMDAAKGYLA